MRFATSRSKPASLYTHGSTRWQQSCSHSNAICNHRFKKRIELRTQEQPLLAEEERIRGWNDRSRTCRTQEVYLSSPAEATLHRKTQGFVLRLPPQNTPHATFMQPLQCVSQHHVANLHVSIHTWQHQMTTIMQPFQCDLQPQTQETDRTTHIGTTTRCRTQRRTNSRMKRPQPHLPHTGGIPVIAGRSHFAQKNTRFRAPASSLKHTPCNIHATVTMRFAASRSKPASLYTHGSTRWQQSCSHSNAICNHRFKKHIELRTQEQPLVAEHRGERIRGWNDRSRTRRTQEVFLSSPAEATLHGKTQGFVLRLPPQNTPHATFMQALQCILQHSLHHHSLRHHFPSSPLPLCHHFPKP